MLKDTHPNVHRIMQDIHQRECDAMIAGFFSGQPTTIATANCGSTFSVDDMIEAQQMIMETMNHHHAPMMNVIVSDHLPRFKMVQYRFPKAKRKRITKKWRRNHRNFRQVEIKNPTMLINGNTLVVNPHTERALREMLPPVSMPSIPGLKMGGIF